MLTLLAAAMLVPPPVPGDDRTAILSAVNHLVSLVDRGRPDQFAAALDPEGRVTIVDMTGAAPVHRVKSLRVMIDNFANHETHFAERIGIPTVLQRGDLAQVWAPYTFWINGTKHHCGIDNFTLLRREGEWIVTELSYTIEPTSTCAALGAPERPQ